MKKRPLSRSEVMSRIRGSDTGPELLVRKALTAQGLRYRVNHRCEGIKVDIAFPGMKLAVFVDGCFWHGCPAHGVAPRTNREFWAEKIAGNKRRDRKQGRTLRAAGWKVLRFWEHEAESAPQRIATKVRDVLEARGSRPKEEGTGVLKAEPGRTPEGRRVPGGRMSPRKLD